MMTVMSVFYDIVVVDVVKWRARNNWNISMKYAQSVGKKLMEAIICVGGSIYARLRSASAVAPNERARWEEE